MIQTQISKEGNTDDDVMEYLDENNSINTDNNEEKKDRIILGIDLGTTNSCVSIWRNGNCEIIPDENGNKTIPSYVSYTNISKYVGSEAKKQKDINSENVFFEFKRLIGRLYKDPSVQRIKDLLSYKIIENERGTVSIQSTIKNNKIFTPEELSACILLKLKDMATKYLKREVKDVVITIPAHFNDSQRQATYDSAKIAGLNCVRIFNEPTAAALAYGMLDRSVNKAFNNKEQKGKNDDDNDDKNGMLIMVYDFGGGTLDISLIDVYDGCFDVKGSSGISHFGGVDFDNRLINYSIAKFSREYYKNNPLDIKELNRLSLQRLRNQCESAKKILSTNNIAYIAVENFHEGKDLFLKITRSDFENLCRDMFLLCIQPVDELLEECGFTENDIDEVILVGGMTRMPYVREMLNNKFSYMENGTRKNKVNCSINPDEAISVGAAIQGYIIGNNDSAFSDSVTLLDKTPLSLGVEVIGGVMDTLIKRNTIIPYEITKLYTTDTDYIDKVLIKIFEGERSMTKYNYKIGEFELDKLPICQRGIPEIEITFAIDINGIVTVTAKEKDSDESKSIIVNTNKNGLTQSQLKKLIDEAVEQETLDELERAKKFKYYEIEDLSSNVITNINNKEFKLTKRDIETITDDIKIVRTWLKEKSYKDRDNDELDEVLEKLKRKYGVLIIKGKLENEKYKDYSETVDATLIVGRDDDEEEDEMRQVFEKVKKEEIGSLGMTENETSEINQLYESLKELCKSVSSVINSDKLKINVDHKHEINNHINDVVLWLYSHDNPTVKDYKEKIDEINSICDKVVDIYKQEGKEIFVKNNFDDSKDKNSQKLEKLCLTLITMIDKKQIRASIASLNVFKNRIEKTLKFMYSRNGISISDTKDIDIKNIDVNNYDHKSINDNLFEQLCEVFINDINTMCDNIYNSTYGINMKQGPIVSAKTQTKNIDVVTDQFGLDYKSKNNKQQGTSGMSIMELMRIKQNEEIDSQLDSQISNKENTN